MILEEVLNKLIRDTVNLILGNSTYSIKAEQNAIRPSGTYCSVNMLTDNSLGLEERTYANDGDDLEETITGLREITVSLNFFRSGSVDNARSVRIGLVRESIQELFKIAGIGLTSRTEVRKISEPLENGYEERAQFDIVLSVVGSDNDIVTSITSVDMAMEYQSRGLIYNLIIEVQ